MRATPCQGTAWLAVPGWTSAYAFSTAKSAEESTISRLETPLNAALRLRLRKGTPDPVRSVRYASRGRVPSPFRVKPNPEHAWAAGLGKNATGSHTPPDHSPLRAPNWTWRRSASPSPARWDAFHVLPPSTLLKTVPEGLPA